MALTKIDDRGLKTPIDLLDNEKIRFGTGNDLEIWHSGVHAFIRNDVTGGMNLQSDNSIWLSDGDGTESYIGCTQNGKVELRYDNIKKFETKSDGVTVTGSLYQQTTGNVSLLIGSTDAGGASIYLDGDSNGDWSGSDYAYIKHNTSGNLEIAAANPAGGGDIHLKVKNSENAIKAYADGAVELYDNNVLKFTTQSNGCKIVDSDTTAVLRLSTSAGDNGYVWGEGTDLIGFKDSQGHWLTKCTKDGAVELYHNNVKAFETTQYGATCKLDDTSAPTLFMVIGSEGQDAELRLLADDGDDNDDYWRILADASDPGPLWIQNYKGGSWESNLSCNGNGSVDLYYDGTKKFETTSYGGLFGTESSSSAASPVRLSLGGTYHDEVGAEPKLSLWANGSGEHMGFGVSGNQLDVILTANDYDFVVYGGGAGNTERFRVYGDSTGIKLPDSSKALFGAGSDLQIYHDGTDSYIKNTTGTLYIKDDVVKIARQSDNSVSLTVTAGGSCELYHNYSKKFETTDYGCNAYTIKPYDDDAHDLGASGQRWDDVYATNGTIQTSDRNAKKDIVKSDLGLTFINAIEPVSYKFKTGTRTHYGVIAQDLETVLDGKDFAGLTKDTETGNYGVRYTELISPLIKAIQELSAEVNTLKTKVAALEAK